MFLGARNAGREFGTSPPRYLPMRRRGSERISLGEPLADVAADSGFADRTHFSRRFKTAYGMMPGRRAQLTKRASQP